MPRDDDLEQRSYRWLWTVAFCAGLASLALIALYYYRNPERSLLADFAPRVPQSLNGSAPVGEVPGDAPGEDMGIVAGAETIDEG